ncbi:MAG: zinc-dependent dehydrogenase [Terracidiphilus sp.]|jgi:L-iditol 2-dehydrogenase
MATQTSNVESHFESKIPATMRAVVYRGVNDMRVETVPVPAIGPGELLIKVATCGICGTDLKKIHTGSHSAPRIFGHEMSGTVVAVGQGAHFELGERVVVHHHVPCGDCYFCRKQTPSQCPLYKKVGVTAGFEPSGGGFAEYIRVMDWIASSRGVVRIPDSVPFEQAAFLEPLNTVLKGVKLLNLAADDTVLVIGQGPIGLMHAALARRTGARVLTSDLYPERHAIAARFGLKDPIHAGSENVVERVFKETDGRGADAVILAVGGNALIKTAMDAARPGGKVMLFAQTQHGEATIDPGAVCMDEKTLLGSYSSSFEILDEVTTLVFGGYRNGFDLTQLISHRFPLEQAVEAIEIASHPKADSMKIMIEPVPGAGAE